MCGDHIELEVRIADGKIVEVGFQGEGCAISTASASLMTDLLIGLTPSEAVKLAEKFRAAIVSGESDDSLGALEALLPIRAYPMRVKCATLPWATLQEALT
jgi:nitrogen fixation protein NifU and related proteins